MMYRVKEGDTLSKIADQYQWSMNQLVALNKISNPNVLEVDQLLLVPSVKDASRDPHQNSHWVQEDQRLEDLLLTDFVTQVKGQLAWPLRNGDGRITSVFGKRRGNFHEGVDIGAPKGTPVYSTAHGKVIYSGTGLSGYGKLIVIKHEGFLSAYAHNRSLYYER
ncbi:MAG: M23 family metallopeptidase, partial [Bdellovibrionales bacterium]|nr:M23 family metallopeptidase [Bdellovibrionales bacterium]